MKINETNIFVFLAAIMFGLLISLNINFSGISEDVVLNARQYQEAYNLRNRLYREISDLKEQQNEKLDRLNKYKNSDSVAAKILQDISDELVMNSIILGTAEAVGEGISITLNDASRDFDGFIDDPFVRWFRIVHNTDVLYVLNSLKNAGAESMSINGQRIVSTSEVYCSGSFLSVNGVKLAAPFYIYVIGNKNSMTNYMRGEDGFLNILETRGIYVKLEKSNNIKLPAYVGGMRFNHMKEVRN
jgi:uncharacterized protein YlxW (UPF0749 family)